MTFGDRVVGAMKLDANAFEDVERDTTAIGQSVSVIVLAAVAAGIGGIWAGGLSGIVSGAVMSLIGFLVWSLIIWLVGTKVMPEPATKADYPETFRVLGFAAAPGLASVLTIVGDHSHPRLASRLLHLGADLGVAMRGNGRRRAAGARLLDDWQGCHRRVDWFCRQFHPDGADPGADPRNAHVDGLTRNRDPMLVSISAESLKSDVGSLKWGSGKSEVGSRSRK